MNKTELKSNKMTMNFILCRSGKNDVKKKVAKSVRYRIITVLIIANRTVRSCSFARDGFTFAEAISRTSLSI